MQYRKHFIPLESNPQLFTSLIHRLGVSKSLAFHDVFSLDDPELLALIPRPVLALVLLFPVSSDYESELAEQDRNKADYSLSGDEEPVIWYRQTIHNACGLYGILHAISNGGAREHVDPGSHFVNFLKKCSPLGPIERALALEDDAELESAHKEVALQGDSEVPASPEDEVFFHYVCFTKSYKDNHLYELDGDRKGPIDWGAFAEEDILSEAGISVIKQFMGKAATGIGFSLLALSFSE